MSDILSTSISGLLAFQQALGVTSNNVSNAATKGYSVENINLREALGQGTASGYIGAGVNVQSITRSYDETLAQQVRSSQASYSAFNTVGTQAAQIDNMLSDTGTGLTATLQAFVNALQSVSTAPTSTAQRQVLLSKAQALTQELNNYQSQISTYSQNVGQQIGTTVNQIDSIAKNIALLNAQISAAEGGTGQTPNQLMDQRDTLIDQLSQYVSVNAVTENNGQMNIYIGSGQGLVVGATAQNLVASPDPTDATKLNIGLQSGNGPVTDITPEITGGTLGGLLTTRSQVLDPTQNALGRIAVGIATVMNQQQAAGMDLNGQPGQPMFAIGGVLTSPSQLNTGSATLSVTRTALSQLTSDDYQLTDSASGWQLQDTTSGQAITMTGTGTSADPFLAAGMSIVVNGSPSTGDTYLIRPTAGAIAGMSVLLTSPSQVAAASLGASAASASNTGKAAISSPTVTSPANWTAGTFTISFTSVSPAQYQVTDSSGNVVTSGNYTSGSPISFNGEQVAISGTPANGDSFTVGPNSTANVGDNTNVLAMAASMSSKVLDGNTASLSDAATGLVSATGVLTQQAQANASAQQTVNQSATDARSNLSGVNLDEEAAKMLQYQQAYQACAQMIQTSNTVFQTLITSIQHG
jgi:flagellar hook-associated protein 1 FlgK